MGGGSISSLKQLRGPMTKILGEVAKQLAELQQYKQRYGSLDTDDSEEGSDTEQE